MTTSIFNIGLQAGDGFWGEVLGESEVLEGTDGAMKAAVVGDGACLIEVDVGMALEFVQGEFVDVQFPRRRIGNHKVILGIEWKILNFIELIDADIASEALSVLHNLAGEIGTDAWHSFQ